LLATVLFYGIYHHQQQTRHQHLAILDTAVLHFGDGGDTFNLHWKESLLGYGTSTTQIITSTFGLNPFGRKFICSHLNHRPSYHRTNGALYHRTNGPSSDRTNGVRSTVPTVQLHLHITVPTVLHRTVPTVLHMTVPTVLRITVPTVLHRTVPTVYEAPYQRSNFTCISPYQRSFIGPYQRCFI
jgi:hypothetical protein